MLPGRHSISISRVTKSRMPASTLTPRATPDDLDRHAHPDLGVHQHADEVEVHRAARNRVPLELPDHRVAGLPRVPELQEKDGVFPGAAAEGVGQRPCAFTVIGTVALPAP